MVGTLESRSTALQVVEAGAMIALNIISLLGNILVHAYTLTSVFLRCMFRL